ncbi:MAG: hypothetical protein LBT86_07780 [Deltaproteobacteria bacterium]|jgi:hypothetical protein|nr:hypothetical protein [Deltaproteobacteria bacterium]
MSYSLLIHDLENPPLKWAEKALVWAARPKVKPCQGCFGCWERTPGVCVINDRAQALPSLLAQTDHLILVSRLSVWGVSPEVKAVLERGLPNLLPFMAQKMGVLLHDPRHPHPWALTAVFYGPLETERQDLAQAMIEAIGLNLASNPIKCHFISELKLETQFCP